MVEATELESTDLISEASEAFRNARISHGERIEQEIAARKLAQIANPKTPLLKDDDKKRTHGIDIFVRGILEDYSKPLAQHPGLKESVQKVANKTKEEIYKDWEETAKAYKNMSFSTEYDPTMVARDDREKEIILEAAKLLGYQISETDDGKRIKPTPRYQTPGDLEQVINNRANIGIKNLLKDCDSEKILRRPVRRTILAMTDHMAKTLRTPAKE